MRLSKRIRWRFKFALATLIQLRRGQPPEVRATYLRMRRAGVSPWRAYELLLAAYEAEVSAMIIGERVFDHAVYLNRLDELPNRPALALRMLAKPWQA